MSLLPHWGNCKQELQDMKLKVCSLERQIDAYMQDLQEVTCKLRQVTLDSQALKCTDCPNSTQETIDLKPDSVVK